MADEDKAHRRHESQAREERAARFWQRTIDAGRVQEQAGQQINQQIKEGERETRERKQRPG